METVVENAINEIKDVFGKVGAEIVAIYPYAHLSSSLSSPDAAKKILINMEAGLEEMGLNVKRVPFGWYKSFEVSCKGHPLSELSRTITAEKVDKEVSDDDKKSESEKSVFYILTGGKIVDVDEFNYEENDS